MLASPDMMMLALLDAQKMALAWGVSPTEFIGFIEKLEAYWKVNRDLLSYF